MSEITDTLARIHSIIVVHVGALEMKLKTAPLSERDSRQLDDFARSLCRIEELARAAAKNKGEDVQKLTDDELRTRILKAAEEIRGT